MSTVEGNIGLAYNQGGAQVVELTPQAMTLVTGIIQMRAIAGYQQAFNVYGAIDFPIGQNKVRVNSLKGDDWVGQLRQSGCAWDPQGIFSDAVSDLTAQYIQLQGQQCTDEFFGSDFESLLDENGHMINDGAGQEVLEMLARKLAFNFMRDLRGMGVQGQLIRNLSSQTMAPKYDPAQFVYLQRSHNAVEGYLRFFAKLNAAQPTKYNHLNLFAEFGTVSTAFENGGKTVTGAAAQDVLEGLYANAPEELEDYLNQEIMQTSDGRDLTPVYIVSPSVYSGGKSFLTQKKNTDSDYNSSFTMELEDVAGTRKNVLRYRGVVVVPDEAMNHYSKGLNNLYVHSAVLTIASNIVFATGFDDSARELMGENPDGTAIKIQRSPLLCDNGKIFMAGNAKFGVGISDVDLVSAAIIAVQDDGTGTIVDVDDPTGVCIRTTS